MLKEIMSEVVVRPDSGAQLDLGSGEITDARPQKPSPEKLRAKCDLLEGCGFTIGPVGPYSVTVSAPVEIYRSAFDADFDTESMKSGHTRFHGKDPSLFRPKAGEWRDVDALVVVATDDLVDHNHDAKEITVGPKPHVTYYHLDAPKDLVKYLNAADLHAQGIDGRGVDLVVVDTGCWKHPWFTKRGLHVDVILGPGATHPKLDEVGHGTMVCASVISLAPGARVRLVKQPDNSAFAAFKYAVGLKPQIIQNTWGTIIESRPIPAAEKLVAHTVRDAIDQKIVIVFAGGNGKKLFPQQLPEAIAVGGAYVAKNGAISAASYASGYKSALFPNRVVPDFCGLVGLRPEGVYLMMPTMPGSIIDRSFAEKPYPEGDGTDKPHDGWVVISGTSSGSGQVSGVVAMLMQAHGDLDQAQVHRILADTARPVLSGKSWEGNPAGLPVPNLATGYGIVDAGQAIATPGR